ncbi:MAG TPA: cytochrome P450 [Symbiobacteriaceae bacterium]|nr:cytochrome P450 [Symbiobacteriaceae bacterium]
MITKAKTAPGPNTRGLMGDLKAYRTDPYTLFTSVWREYGDFVRLRFGPIQCFLPGHPDYLKHILLDNYQNYDRGQLFKKFERYTGPGLLTGYGDTWLKTRRLAQPAFRPDILDQYAAVMADGAQKLVERWRPAAEKGGIIEASDEMVYYILGTLGRTLFSIDLSEHAADIIPAAHYAVITQVTKTGTIEELLPEWMPTPHYRRVKAIRALFDAIVVRIVDLHRKGMQTSDYVSLLLKEEANGNLTAGQVHAETLTALIAGHDTTAAALTWLLYVLAMHPEVQAQVRAEADQVLGGRAPTVADLPQFVYTKKTIMETLRLYPPAWLFPREPAEDDEIGGYHVPKRSLMMLTPYLVHRHPEFWENPEVFDPHRFGPEFEKGRHKYSYMPFGGGAHQCIGMHYAMQQLIFTAALITRAYRVELAPGGPVLPETALTMHPRGGLRIRITVRG